MAAEYTLKLSWSEINWLKNIVREKRTFYNNAGHINYTSEKKIASNVEKNIEDTMCPVFGD